MTFILLFLLIVLLVFAIIFSYLSLSIIPSFNDDVSSLFSKSSDILKLSMKSRIPHLALEIKNLFYV